MLINKAMPLVFILSIISLSGVGFSSWVIGTSNVVANGNITIADVETIDLQNTVAYVRNSEQGFDYYIYDGVYYFTDTSFSIRIQINPYLMDTKLNYSHLSLYFGLSYMSLTSNNYDIFASDNAYTTPPTKAVYAYEKNPEFYMESDAANYSKIVNGTSTTYSLSTNIMLYGNDNSLYSFAKKYQINQTSVYLTATYNFDLKNDFLSNIDKYKNLNMKFYLSVKGV